MRILRECLCPGYLRSENIMGNYRTAHSTNALGLLTLMEAMYGDCSIIYDKCYTFGICAMASIHMN